MYEIQIKLSARRKTLRLAENEACKPIMEPSIKKIDKVVRETIIKL